jgi:hypothetical protein
MGLTKANCFWNNNALGPMALFRGSEATSPSWVNADRLTKLIAAQRSPRLRALGAALARGQSQDRRFARLAALYVGLRQDLTEAGTEFQVARHGEDPRFAGSPVRVASHILRDRAGDVLQPAELATRHHAYRCRVMMGPSYRADMWAALEEDPTLSAAALARRTYGSFATAWHVRCDFGLLPQAHRRPPRRPPYQSAKLTRLA